jgi:hypothetical protein
MAAYNTIRVRHLRNKSNATGIKQDRRSFFLFRSVGQFLSSLVSPDKTAAFSSETLSARVLQSNKRARIHCQKPGSLPSACASSEQTAARREMSTFKDYHASEDPSEENKVMHAMLEADNGMTFMAKRHTSSCSFSRRWTKLSSRGHGALFSTCVRIACAAWIGERVVISNSRQLGWSTRKSW